MLKENDKVTMLRDDGLAEKGWIGVVKWVGSTHMPKNIEVLWDNGKKFYHSYTHLAPKKFNTHDEVVLLYDDGYAKKGLKGAVVNYDHLGVKVRWGVMGISWHLYKSIAPADDKMTNPNTAFRIRKQR
jgi:hypothetical protein